MNLCVANGAKGTLIEPTNQLSMNAGIRRLNHYVSTGCATYRWNLSRATSLPVIFKLAIEMAAAESQDRVCSSNGPEHS